MFRLFLLFILTPWVVQADEISTEIGAVVIEEIASGLDEPWSLAFLPEGFLVTERGGKLLYFDGRGGRVNISGAPETQRGGQAGLFDVLVPSDFTQSREIFLSYADPEGSGTAVMSARLNLEQAALTHQTRIFLMNSPFGGDFHFGGRMVEASSTEIFLALGERGARYAAQDPDVDNGSVVKVKRDGSSYEFISKGHRNPQGAALDARGQLFVNEHGAKGGDELNLVEKGRNYGWPVISYGANYDGTKIGEGTKKAGMEQPKFYWDPSIAPSGMAIHSGRNWPDAEGLFFIGSLKFDEIAVVKSGDVFQQVAAIRSPETARVRDVREAPDGSIWFLSVVNGGLYRIAPK